MPEPWYILSAILVAAGVTWLLRAVPFLLLRPVRESELLAYLGERMPAGIMVILTFYTLRHVEPTVLASVGPAALGLAVTIGLQLWRGSAILSIFAGTAVYAALASTVGAA